MKVLRSDLEEGENRFDPIFQSEGQKPRAREFEGDSTPCRLQVSMTRPAFRL